MNFFTFLCLCFLGVSCCSSKNLTNPPVEQGIAGYVREVTGNRMPGPDVKLPEPKGIKTTLYVYEKTNLDQVDREGSQPLYKEIRTQLVDSVHSDDSGKFELALPPGDYSLFTKVKDNYFSNRFDGNNNIYVITVEKNKVTKVDFLVDINAVY